MRGVFFLADTNRFRRRPPYVTYALILVNLVCYLAFALISYRSYQKIFDYGLIPKEPTVFAMFTSLFSARRSGPHSCQHGFAVDIRQGCGGCAGSVLVFCSIPLRRLSCERNPNGRCIGRADFRDRADFGRLRMCGRCLRRFRRSIPLCENKASASDFLRF